MIKCPTHPKYKGLAEPKYKGLEICWCRDIFECVQRGTCLEIFTNAEGTQSYIIQYKKGDHDGLWHWMNCANKKECADPDATAPRLCGAAGKSECNLT